MPAPRIFFLLFPLLALGCRSTPPPGGVPEDRIRRSDEVDDDEVLEPLKRAKNLYAGGDLVGARRSLEQALAADPDHLRARYLMARVLAGLGEVRGARSALIAVLEEQPTNALVLDLLASVEEQLGLHRSALVRYQALNLELQARAAARNQET